MYTNAESQYRVMHASYWHSANFYSFHTQADGEVDCYVNCSLANLCEIFPGKNKKEEVEQKAKEDPPRAEEVVAEVAAELEKEEEQKGDSEKLVIIYRSF